MWRVTLQQIRHSRGRTLALASGITVAAAAFSLLMSAVTTGRAVIRGDVDNGLHATYDLLVRAPGSVSQTERTGAMVNDNYLAGVFGGITRAQYERIRGLEGVDVAAPIAMVGYVLRTVDLPVDITSVVADAASKSRAGIPGPAPDDQVYRVSGAHVSDRGLSVFPRSGQTFVFVSSHSLASLFASGRISWKALPGVNILGAAPAAPPLPPGSDTGGTVCVGGVDGNGAAQHDKQWQQCLPDPVGGGHLVTQLEWSFPALVAAVDPVAEDRLDGLAGAVTSGRWLTEADRTTVSTAAGGQTRHIVPLVAGSTPFVDDALDVRVDRLDAAKLLAPLPPTPALPPTPPPTLPPPLPPTPTTGAVAAPTIQDLLTSATADAPGTDIGHLSYSSQDAYNQLLAKASAPVAPNSVAGFVDAYWTTEPTTLGQLGPQHVSPRPTTNPDSVWSSLIQGGGTVTEPTGAADVNFRTLREHVADNHGRTPVTMLSVVGTFDPAKLPGYAGDRSVPLQVFNPPVAHGADNAARAALGNRPLLPEGDPAGYLQQTPTLFTTLSALDAFGPPAFPDVDQSAPISAIRIKVAGLHGDARAQLNTIAQVALRIRNATGLDVDITAGTSAVALAVDLPAGSFGRPALSLTEDWMQEGASLRVLDAVDHKSLTLFILVVVVTALFLLNGVQAALRPRRAQIGVLRALGWSRPAVFRLLLGEVAVVGAAAGAAGTASAAALIAVLGLRMPVGHALLVLPVAVVMAVLAGLVPVWRAANTAPRRAIVGGARAPRRARPVRGLIGVARAGLRGVPGRTAVAVIALAIGIAALTATLGVDKSFRSGGGGTALSAAAGEDVRGVDYLSVALTVLLGAVCVADAVFLGLRERADEFAALRAAGWHRKHVARVALFEGLVIAILGGVLGATAGSLFGGSLPAGAVAGAGGVLLVTCAVGVALRSLARMSLTAALAEEE
ncbi:hypothetical protein GCM10009839_44250 [Catenulispora yoronensis]|uniref:ABC3 transporter permease C-terminal domain-containing protein n=1 Tax=Catenulispora yoronensis TaxID=450799 RepID=A0ABP5G2B7_9ACTN